MKSLLRLINVTVNTFLNILMMASHPAGEVLCFLGCLGIGWLVDPGMSEKLDFSVIFAVIMTVSTMMVARCRDSGSRRCQRWVYKQSDLLSNRANIEEKLHSLDYCKQA
jgi:hypothetical protein